MQALILLVFRGIVFDKMMEESPMKAYFINGAVLVVVLTGCLPFSEPRAQMYRCGSAYQDRPCDGDQPGKPVAGAGSKAGAADSSAAASSGPAVDPACAQRGIDSQKIVWSREGGATEEKLLSEETNPARKRLIADVYRVRGSAPQVRARIEAECQAEMAEKAKALALHEAMVKAGVQPATGAASAGPGPEEKAAAARLQAQKEEQRVAAEKKSRCGSLNAQLDSIRERQRAGGSGAYMDSLNSQRRDVDRDMRSAGC